MIKNNKIDKVAFLANWIDKIDKSTFEEYKGEKTGWELIKEDAAQMYTETAWAFKDLSHAQTLCYFINEYLYVTGWRKGIYLPYQRKVITAPKKLINKFYKMCKFRFQVDNQFVEIMQSI